jgi:hypothetical protein
MVAIGDINALQALSPLLCTIKQQERCVFYYYG